MQSDSVKATDADLLHEVLYQALLEIRETSRDSNASNSFRLADLLHNVPTALARAQREEVTFASVLRGLEERADEKGCRAWLENVRMNLARNDRR